MTAPTITPDGRKSDLPAGWDQPTQLPPGGIKIEDLPSGWTPSSQVKPGTQTVPPGKKGAAAGKPMAAPPPPAAVETTEDVMGEKVVPQKPPSRWGD